MTVAVGSVGSVGGSVSDDSAALVGGAGSGGMVDWLDNDLFSWCRSIATTGAAGAGATSSAVSVSAGAGATSVVAAVVVVVVVADGIADATISVGWGGIVSVAIAVTMSVCWGVMVVTVLVDWGGVGDSWGSSAGGTPPATGAACNLGHDSVGSEGDA